jgi:HEAT repeat protein
VNILLRIFRIQPGERRTVGLVVGLMFLSVAGLTIGESGISALFFDRIGTDALPLMYLGQGAVGLVGMLALTGVLGRFDRRKAYVVLPLLLAGTVAVERAVAAADPAWIYPVMWLTASLASLGQAVGLWGTAGLVTDTRGAKRLFPLFGAGSILGAVAGGLGTGPLASAIGAENLLVMWTVALLGSSALCAVILGLRRGAERSHVRSRRPSAVAELRQGFAFVRHSTLLLWMGAASILFSLLFYSLYLPFAQAASSRYPDPEQLARFFGIFWAAVTGIAFVVSILLANRLLGWFGAAAMLVVLPILYAGSFGILLVTSTFGALVAIRLGVNVWLQGVTSPSWETLVNVTPENRRDQTRAFLNGGPAQAGTAIAGVVQLVGQETLTARQLSMIGLVAAGIAVVVGLRIRRSYTTALVDAIRAGRPRIFDDAIPNAPIPVQGDGQATSLALAAMDDRDPRMRRLALDLVASADDPRGVEALRHACEDPDAMVRAHAVEAARAAGLLNRADARHALDDTDAGVRLAVVRTMDPVETPAAMLDDPDASVAAASAARLLAGPSRPVAEDVVRRLLSAEDPEVRLAAVRELGAAASSEDVEAMLRGSVDDPSAPVRAAALRVSVAVGPHVVVPVALEALASGDPFLRHAALDALGDVDLRGFEAEIHRVVETRASLAERDRSMAASVPRHGDGCELLRDALLSRGRTNAIVALSALSVTSDDPLAMRVAVEHLSDGAGGELANVLETIEVVAGSSAPWPLLALWEPAPIDRLRSEDPKSLDAAVEDDDPFIRACAELARSHLDEGGTMARPRSSMSPMELVLVLRGIPLFSALAPAELQRVAAISEERSYSKGEVIGAEGELGDEMHVVLDGAVRVVRSDGGTIARRGAGDAIGEMSVITRTPRVASLIADGNVRALRIGHREFEAMVRERPDIALAVMRVLAERLGSMTTDR